MKPTKPVLIPWDIILKACSLTPIEIDHLLIAAGEHHLPAETVIFDGLDDDRTFMYTITYMDAGIKKSDAVSIYVLEQPVSHHFTLAACILPW